MAQAFTDKKEMERHLYATDPEYRARKKANASRWYYANRERALANAARHYEEVRQFITQERQKPCEDCGLDNPVCIQFHHLDPAQKKFEVSQASTLNQAVRELAKCVRVCANCHCIREAALR